MVESAGQKSLPDCYISDGPRYWGPMYSAPTNAVRHYKTKHTVNAYWAESYKIEETRKETARGEDCTVRFRDFFGVEHMIDFSDKNKTYRDPIQIWVPA